MFVEKFNKIKSSVEIGVIDDTQSILQLSELLDFGFSVPSGGHFFDDFPVWNPKFLNKNVNRIGLYIQDELVSAAAIRIAQLKMNRSEIIPMAVLGAVVTHPKWKGQGLASKVVSLALDKAVEGGARICFLWGSEYSLYHRQGFEFYGEQIRIPLKQVLQHSSRLSQPIRMQLIQNIMEGWNPEIFSFARLRDTGLILNSSDLNWYPFHKNVRWFWTTDALGRLDAYVGFGRGIDLINLVHEWGGNFQKVLSILEKIDSNYQGGELLASPSHLHDFGLSELDFTLNKSKPEFLVLGEGFAFGRSIYFRLKTAMGLGFGCRLSI